LKQTGVLCESSVIRHIESGNDWREGMPGLELGESTIRDYVRERKLKLRLIGREIFVPQSYWAEEAAR
jgi:hypothetical protein